MSDATTILATGDDTSILDKDLKGNIGGINVSLQEILGDKIIESYIAQLTSDHMEAIYNDISKEIFQYSHDYETNEDKLVGLKHDRQYTNSYGHTSTEETPLWKIAREEFIKKYSEQILEAVNKIMASDEFKEKVDKVAQDIVEYAVNGYKEDLIRIIRNRMVIDKVSEYPTYNNSDLLAIIHSEIHNALQNIFPNRGY